MTARTIEAAKEGGFPLIMSESSSAYTQRNKINKFQFEKVVEITYEGNYENYSEMPAEIKESHKTSAVLVKRLGVVPDPESDPVPDPEPQPEPQPEPEPEPPQINDINTSWTELIGCKL